MKKKIKNKSEKMIKKQILWNLIAIALVIIVLNLSILVYPSEGMSTTNTTITFAWLGLASSALVDDNPQLTSPLIIEKSTAVDLEPGTYYWCVPSFTYCIRKSNFTIQSEVAISTQRIQAGEASATYSINNTGNVLTKLEARNWLNKLITGMFILEVGTGKNITINETSEFIASQE